MNQDWKDVSTHMNKAMREVDNAFRSAERCMDSIQTEMVVDTGEHNLYRITATTRSARWRLFKVFWRVAWAILLKGRSNLKVKKTVQTGQTGRWNSTTPNTSNPPQ